eukprot:7712053-Alexandrium_andersonii.AAC.1
MTEIDVEWAWPRRLPTPCPRFVEAARERTFAALCMVCYFITIFRPPKWLIAARKVGGSRLMQARQGRRKALKARVAKLLVVW